MRAPPDTITIQRLRLLTRIGVPEDERAEPQELEVSLKMVPKTGFSGLDDEVARTVDYFEVSQWVARMGANGERKLIETLAEEIAIGLLADFNLQEIAIEVRKFILPETEYVSVSLTRWAAGAAESRKC